MKHCPKCNSIKPLEEFRKDASKKNGRGSICKLCNRAIVKRWDDANPERVAAKNKKWNGENPKKKKAGVKDWQDRHPGIVEFYNHRYYAANSEEIKADKKQWRQDNPEKVSMQNSRYRARVAAAQFNDLLVQEWLFLKHDLYAETCAYCGCHDKLLTKDHIIAMDAGGNNTMSNILPACKSCNSKKKHRKFIIPLLLRCADGVARPPDAFVPQWRIPVPVVVPQVSNVSQTQLPLF